MLRPRSLSVVRSFSKIPFVAQVVSNTPVGEKRKQTTLTWPDGASRP